MLDDVCRNSHPLGLLGVNFIGNAAATRGEGRGPFMYVLVLGSLGVYACLRKNLGIWGPQAVAAKFRQLPAPRLPKRILRYPRIAARDSAGICREAEISKRRREARVREID